MKSGTITVSGSDTILTGKVAPASAVILTLAALTLACFINDNEGDKRLVVVDFAARKVGTKLSVSGDLAALNTAILADASLTATFTKLDFVVVDGAKSSSEWGVQNESAQTVLETISAATHGSDFQKAVGIPFGPKIPTKSWNSLIGSIEDALAKFSVDNPSSDETGVLVIDQLENVTRLYCFTTPPVADFTAGISGHATTAVFTQDVAAASATGLYNQ